MSESKEDNSGSPSSKEPSGLRTAPINAEADVETAARKLSEASPAGFQRISEFMAISSGMAGQINPLHQKMNEGHITQVLDLAVKHDERQYELNKSHLALEGSNRWFRLTIFLTCVAVLLTVLIMFRDNQSFIEKFMAALFSFGAGFGSGWGFSRVKPKRNSNV